MSEPRVWTFFYGSYMNHEVLKEVNLVPERWELARLSGFDIVIRPRANLIRSAERCVYGIVATATHRELERLYAHARDVLGEVYLPEAVLVELLQVREHRGPVADGPRVVAEELGQCSDGLQPRRGREPPEWRKSQFLGVQVEHLGYLLGVHADELPEGRQPAGGRHSIEPLSTSPERHVIAPELAVGRHLLVEGNVEADPHPLDSAPDHIPAQQPGSSGAGADPD